MSNINKKFKLAKVDPDFLDILRTVNAERKLNKIDTKIRSDRELTRMIMNTPSFSKVKHELATIPTKEDLIKLRRRELKF